MELIHKEELRRLRRDYRVGTSVELVHMDDQYCPSLQPGSIGRVVSVDDIGTIHVKWDCGSSLGIVYGEDLCRIIEENTKNTQTNQASQKPGDAPHE